MRVSTATQVLECKLMTFILVYYVMIEQSIKSVWYS